MTKIKQALRASLKKTRGKKGFTLIELIVVILILGALVALIVPNVVNYVAQARQATADANARMIYQAAQMYVAIDAPASVGNVTWAKDDIVGTSGKLTKHLGTNFKGEVATVTFVGGQPTVATWKEKSGDSIEGKYPSETVTP